MPELIRCPSCRRDLPESEFGICRARRTGRNLYDKECIRKRVYAGRQAKKQWKAARKRAQERALTEAAQTDRKPNAISPIVKQSPVTKVLFAVRAGKRTRLEIRDATGLNLDQIGDALAELAFCRKEIRIKRRDEYEDIQSVAA